MNINSKTAGIIVIIIMAVWALFVLASIFSTQYQLPLFIHVFLLSVVGVILGLRRSIRL